jgi:hypothetical protein
LLTGFSQPVPANVRVDLEFEIGDDYSMMAKATVPSASIEKTQQVKLKPLVVPPVEELRRQFQQLRSEFSSRLENMPDGEQKAKIGVEGDRIIDEIDGLLSTEFPETTQAFMLIKRLYLLLKQAVPATLSPPKAEMDGKFQEARDLLANAASKKESIREQNYGPILDTLEGEAQRAYQQNDAGVWGSIAGKLDEIIATLQQAIGGGGGGGIDEIPLVVLMNYLAQEINGTRNEIAAKSQSGELSPDIAARANRELDEAQQKADQIDPSDETAAKREIVRIFQQHISAAKQLAGVADRGDGPDIM